MRNRVALFKNSFRRGRSALSRVTLCPADSAASSGKQKDIFFPVVIWQNRMALAACAIAAGESLRGRRRRQRKLAEISSDIARLLCGLFGAISMKTK